MVAARPIGCSRLQGSRTLSCPLMHIRGDDPRLAWEGAVSVEHTAEWSQAWRIPHARRALFPPEALLERTEMPAGVRLTFRSNTQSIVGEVEPHEEVTQVDLYVDGEWLGSAPLAGVDNFRFDGIFLHQPRQERLVELWLPQHGRFRLRSVSLSEGASLSKHEDTRKRWITYGSSITQCRTASSPSHTWPGIVAREHGVHLTCLGYGGQCHLDTMVARMIRDLPADYLSMCVGINIYGAGSLGPRAFRPAIIGFVQTVREKHPVLPYVVLSPIFSPPRETTKNRVDFTLQDMRDEVALAVETLRAQGDANLHYVDGLEIFGPDLAHLLPDELHPNAEGYKLMGRNFREKVAQQFFT
jgi:hypothetical protein